MMLITKTATGNELTIAIEGRLDTTTAPQLEKELEVLSSVKELVIDMIKLDYISSAGLRVLLKAQKYMNEHGSMTIKNAVPEVMNIFETTGFNEILHIE